MPRAPPRTSRHKRRSSDASLDAAPHDGQTENSREQTHAKVVSNADGTSGESERSLKTPAGAVARLGLENVASPAFTAAAAAAASPSSTGVLAPTNTRRIGSKFCIDLVKGGFVCFGL